MIFRNRTEAGRKLGTALAHHRRDKCLVLALPRGGVPVAAEVANALGAPLDLILVRKIGAPVEPEVAVGAVVDGGNPIVVKNQDMMRLTGTGERAFQSICETELKEIERRRAVYLCGRMPIDPSGRVVIVVDDGLATGSTMKAALQAERQRNPRILIAAVPIAPQETVDELALLADEVVCLDTPEPFGSVGRFYNDFRQVSDHDVRQVLNRFRPTQGGAG